MVFRSAPEHEGTFESACRMLAEVGRALAAPDALQGDLLLAMVPYWQDGSEADGPAEAVALWRGLVNQRRWRFLVRRIESSRRRLQAARPSRAGRAHADRESGRERFVRQLTTVALGVLGPLVQKLRAANLLEERALNLTAEGVESLLEDVDATVSEIVRDEVLATLEIICRTAVLSQASAIPDRDAIEACMRQRWVGDEFEVRLLSPEHLKGDYAEVLPGDYGGVRGVTKKLREDQIPKILPAEYAAWQQGGLGRVATLDKIVNRSPTCLENFDTRSPHAQHEVLVVISLFGVHESASLPRHEMTPGHKRCRIEARAIAFDLLTQSAVKVPRDQVKVDVLWLEGFHEGHWLGSFFPLSDLHAVTRAYGMGWRNVAEVDRVVPDLFVEVISGIRGNHRYGVRRIADKPLVAIQRLLSSRDYRSVSIAGVAPRAHLPRTLPSRLMSLPTPRGIPSVLLATADPPAGGGKKDRKEDPEKAREQEDPKCHAALHPHVLSATIGVSNLQLVTREDLVRSWLWMLIGPAAEAEATPPLVEAFV